MKFKQIRSIPGLVFSIFMLLIVSCSISKLATRKLTDSLAGSSGLSFTSDDDPELIADALPFTIKMYESLMEKDSTNAALYLATSKLLCLYSQYFVAAPMDTITDPVQKKAIGKRAKKLFLRAREYALKSIDIAKPDSKKAFLTGNIDSTISTVSQSDTSALFWTSVAWFGAIGSDKSDMSLAMGIKKPLTITRKLIEMNPTFYQGMAHELMGIVSVNIPKSLGGSTDTAAYYFSKAIQLSDSSRVSAFVLYATLVAVKTKNKDLYVSLLEKANSIPIDAYPPLRLQNSIYLQKARLLLKNVNEVFPEVTE
jgi:predicted anti-sigma-YlaC factor YlaD